MRIRLHTQPSLHCAWVIRAISVYFALQLAPVPVSEQLLAFIYPSSKPCVIDFESKLNRYCVARRSSHGAGGVKGKDTDDTDIDAVIAVREAEATAAGLVVDRRLLKLRTSDEFIHFARTHGATVKPTGSNRMRISKHGVWRDIDAAGRKRDLQNSEIKKTMRAFKAMGIAYSRKR
mmetsp:Transcript_36747/g.83138  ORF Transcript_36747/g.83138 Transcript_36747/m.83138 type:complete len:176 (+) Transcript_36747:81-608(+)